MLETLYENNIEPVFYGIIFQ